MSLIVDFKKRFAGFELDIQFSSKGQTLGILGPSGSGKSMTLKCIAGVETPDEGYIEVNGRVLFDSKKKINIKPQTRRVGYLFQKYALFPHMSVEENIACALSGTKSKKGSRIESLLAFFKLEGYGKRYPEQLSGGQQQRVALARILAFEPEVLLLDEPFSALDSHLKEAMQMEMLNLLKDYAGDTVMVTHSRDEVYKLSNDLLILDKGRALELGPTREMFLSPRKLGTARLTGCKNFSCAKSAGTKKVAALDWGCVLTVSQPLPEKFSHIGVRAHNFYPCNCKNIENAIPVAFYGHVEGPFEWNLLFRNADAGEHSGKIWWKYAKEKGSTELPAYLAVAPEDILLLEE